MAEEVFDNPTGWVADHVRRYVESGGRAGTASTGATRLLLTTRGRRTGRLRRTALYYGRDGDRTSSRLWERMVRVLPRYLAYEREAGRELPVVVIEAVRDR